MKLVTYLESGKTKGGIVTRDGIISLESLGVGGVMTVDDLVCGSDAVLAEVRAKSDAGENSITQTSSVKIIAPLPVPRRNIFCVGKNYFEHAKEFERSGFDASSKGQDIPEVPVVFTKAPTSVIGSGDDVDSSLDPTGTLDYEGELAVVIGRGGRGISVGDAMRHVFGYTIVNDITSREVQNRHRQWFLGKSADTFCPMGPTLVTVDEIEDVKALRLQTHVNGEIRQDAMVRDLIFDIPSIISTISSSITLWPGDIIATGTPAGVAIGFNPPRYLRPGDRVEVTVGGIGTLRNRVI